VNALDRLVDEGFVAPAVPLGALTTYKLGGPARYFHEATSREGLQRVVRASVEAGVPVLVLGRGSNLVVSERGFDGLVLRLSGAFGAIEFDGEDIVAGGAVHLPSLARSAVRAGRLGLEFYVGIPGSVGGAVRQNAGCHGQETADHLLAAEILEVAGGQIEFHPTEALDLGYRHSSITAGQVVLGARFRTIAGDRLQGEARLREITRWRKSHQPGGTLNAGSVFKNPPGDAAGRIIDELGLKGLTVGGAAVSERHANFFVASDRATPSDLHRLVIEVRRRVRQATGIDLEPEIVFVGEFEDR
jgi:UDP-N-acetylmuramate dehydrogenase